MTISPAEDVSLVKRFPGLNRNVGYFLLYSAIFHVGLLGIGDVLLNFYFVSLGHGSETVGILQSMPRLGGFITGLPVGLIANRIGNRRMLIISTIGIGLSMAFPVVFTSLLALGLSRFLVGFFYGANQIVTSPYMVTLTRREEHTHQFAYQNVVSMAGVALGSIVGGYLPLLLVTMIPVIPVIEGVPPERTSYAYAGAILIASVIVVLSAFPLFSLPRSRHPVVSRDVANRMASIENWRRLIWLAVPLLFFGFSGGLTFPFYNLFFRTRFEIPDSTVGTILALGWLGMGLVPLFNPLWERYIGRVNALMALMGIAALAFIGLSVAQTLVVAVGYYVMAISVRNAYQPLYQPLLMDTLPQEWHNIASGMGMFLWNIGWFGATMCFGFLEVHFGYGAIMKIVALTVAITGLSVLLTFRRASKSGGNTI